MINRVCKTLFITLLFIVPVLSFAEVSSVKIYAELSDGGINLGDLSGFSADWEPARNFAGNLAGEPNVIGVLSGVRSDRGAGFWRIYRASIPFDLSELPDSAEIVGASLYLYGAYNRGDIETVITTHDRQDFSSLVNEDWYITNFGQELSRGKMLSEEYVQFKFAEDGLDILNNDEVVLGLLTNFDYDNESPPLGIGSSFIRSSAFYTANAVGTSTDPYLEIAYVVEEAPPTFSELLTQLEQLIEGLSKQLQNKYGANLKKIGPFMQDEQYRPAFEQVSALVQKVEEDMLAGTLDPDMGEEMANLLADLKELVALTAQAAAGVPLITQIASPYPSLFETTDWADDLYASGTAATSCGTTIEECGCALASMSMLAGKYNLTKGVDGTEVNPKYMNAWLTQHEGYTAWGGALWGKILEYLSKKLGNDTLQSHLSLIKHNETDLETIGNFVTAVGPAMGYNGLLGHFFLLTSQLAPTTFTVRDPWWYNTLTSNDVKQAGGFVQDHNDTISKANLFKYSETPQKLARMVEIRLGSPAELLVTNAAGQRVGYIASTSEVVFEIEGGSYDQGDAIFSTGVVNSPHVGKTLMLLEPTDDVYTLEVIGTGTGEYDLTVLTIGDSGKSEVTSLRGSTAANVVDTYVIDLEQEGSVLAELMTEIETLTQNWDESERSFVLNKLRILADLFTKGNVHAVDAVVAGLLRYLNGVSEAEVPDVVTLLETYFQ